ncbi:MAG: family 43 glycosylhydrolase [Planctomycetaceae bacterium]|uniref:Extracellular exo-alpha-(1->5)-L-arabinofuranosidase n=1 Tax=Lacipirellula limnantheis TaxID=2528024 RepID=A0A517U4A7_9BACT|nr:PA14 domain-containing protein [Lacipirellula limnantheis]MBL9162101.1 family 43 glycosylhydrolase [Planctomycetaceae bacterium]QDT75458.1 Extracellular exo-alpha-(1->5)-L-arabinofuranosidase precursor [Lacipirellula limnantheis]
MLQPLRARNVRTLTTRSLQFESLEPRRVLAGHGLTAQYFHNVDFTGLAAEREEAPSFAWGLASPAPGMDAESFSVRWFGGVEAKYTETYTIRTVSDDGVRLWVDGKLLIDDWAASNARVESATIDLQAGEQYDIRLEYFDATGSAQLRLQWSSASQPLETIPAAQLYASPAGLAGAYGDAFGHAGRRTDSTINFNWGTGQPISGVAADNFQVRWTGYLRPDVSETYQFRIRSDEQVRLWIGNELIIDHWSPHALAEDIGVKQLEAGKWYDIRLEYADVSGNAQVDLAWQSFGQTGGEFSGIPAANLRAAQESPLYATNPLGPGQDPFVIQWEGTYLHVRSAGGGVWIDQADRLEDIHPSDPASTSVKVWTAPTGTNHSSQIWAPELHQLNGKWYIYVAASSGTNATHRMHVLERDDPNPVGPYVYKGQLAASTDRWAIDGTVLQWQGGLYFIWSGWPGTRDGQQNLYIAQMTNPWTISGDRTLLSMPTLPWEQYGLPINEGPQVLIHEGQLHIIYSASGYWTDQYALGRLTYDGVGSIMNANSWTKAPTPVFQQAGDVVGVGHASFVKSPDGTEDWIVYHAHHDRLNWQDDRDILIQQFTFHPDGTPNFGTPIPKTTPVAVPSGYVDPNRDFVLGDYDASEVVNSADLTVFAGLFGLPITPGISADGDVSGLVDGNDFLVWQRRFGATPPVLVPLRASSAPAATGEISTENNPADAAPAIAAEETTGANHPTILLNAALVDLAMANESFRRDIPSRARTATPNATAAPERPRTAERTTPFPGFDVHHSLTRQAAQRFSTNEFSPSVAPCPSNPLDYFFSDLLSASES